MRVVVVVIAHRSSNSIGSPFSERTQTAIRNGGIGSHLLKRLGAFLLIYMYFSYYYYYCYYYFTTGSIIRFRTFDVRCCYISTLLAMSETERARQHNTTQSESDTERG